VQHTPNTAYFPFQLLRSTLLSLALAAREYTSTLHAQLMRIILSIIIIIIICLRPSPPPVAVVLYSLCPPRCRELIIVKEAFVFTKVNYY